MVGLPLTLRGEHGLQADETAEFVEALRGAVEVPVETYDERFTSVLADGDDASAAAHLLESYLRVAGATAEVAARDHPPPADRRGRRSRCSSSARRDRSRAGASRARPRTEAAPATTAPPPPPKPFHIVFPEGFTREDMADRVVAVAEIARRKRNANVRLNRTAYRAASARGIVPCFGRKPQTNLEGFLFPATYEFLKDTTSRRLVADQIEAFCAQLAQGRPALRALEEPDAVRRAHDRVDGREGGEGAARSAS